MIPQDFLKTVAIERHVSRRELDVLSLAMEGESIATIAQKLSIKQDAVRKRLSEIYHKFQIEGRGPVKLTKLQQHLIKKYQRQSVELSLKLASSPKSVISGNSIHWRGAPDVSLFYGRSYELGLLNNWIIDDRCRLIAIWGLGGVGKTALAVKIAQQIQEQFDYLIWRSLIEKPALKIFLRDLLKLLEPEIDVTQFSTIEQQISQLINYFQAARCLLILDGFESLFAPQNLAGTYAVEYQNYGKMLRRLGEEMSKSCIILTSRDKVGEISLLEGHSSPVRSLHLGSLQQDTKLLLAEKEVGNQAQWEQLIQNYRGNPLMIKLATTTIHDVFDGDVGEFMKTTIFPHSIIVLMKEILEQISDLEWQALIKIAEQDQPIQLVELFTCLANIPRYQIISAVDSLRQRSLLEKSRNGFMVLPVIRETIAEI